MTADLFGVQIGLNTVDMAGSLRLYSDALGFMNGGAQGLWGETIGVQGLPPEARAIVWWMVGRQDFFQLEMFQHSRPAQRPMPADWRPCDLGWVRFGVAVDNFDRFIGEIAEHDVELTGCDYSEKDRRRAAFRDPYIGVMVEVVEDKGASGPAVTYATTSVRDLDAARHHYGTLIGLDIVPLDALHTAADEALWGLPGADRDGFVARAGDLLIEVVRYRNPRGKSRPRDYRASDQGMVNIALSGKDVASISEVLQRLRAAGYIPPRLTDVGNAIGGYIVDPEREIELLSFPAEWRAQFGYKPGAPFLR